MSANTSIEWTDRTWNPVRGCSVISQGCVNCYAMKQAHRFSGEGKSYEGLTKLTKAGPQWTGAVQLVREHLGDPIRWKRPQRVFVNSMSDLFHEAVPDNYIEQVFAVMSIAERHTFQVLTKRPERMAAWFSVIAQYDTEWARRVCAGLPNVWLGVSVEDQQRADERIPQLLSTPAAVRFISAEPLLGPVDLRRFMPVPLFYCGRCGKEKRRPWCEPCGTDNNTPTNELVGLSWVIVGGESGPGARPFDVAWARALVHQCKSAGVAVFVKQLGSKPTGWWSNSLGPRIGKFTDRKGGDMAEWPEDLRIRQFPEAEPLGELQ